VQLRVLCRTLLRPSCCLSIHAGCSCRRTPGQASVRCSLTGCQAHQMASAGAATATHSGSAWSPTSRQAPSGLVLHWSGLCWRESPRTEGQWWVAACSSCSWWQCAWCLQTRGGSVAGLSQLMSSGELEERQRNQVLVYDCFLSCRGSTRCYVSTPDMPTYPPGQTGVLRCMILRCVARHHDAEHKTVCKLS
jgi:hypothetical protein